MSLRHTSDFDMSVVMCHSGHAPQLMCEGLVSAIVGLMQKIYVSQLDNMQLYCVLASTICVQQFFCPQSVYIMTSCVAYCISHLLF